MSRDYSDDFGPNAGYVAELESLYRSHDALVPTSWKSVFEKMPKTNGNGGTSHVTEQSVSSNGAAPQSEAQYYADNLLLAFRKLGTFLAQINPLTSVVSKDYGDELRNILDSAAKFYTDRVTVTVASETSIMTLGEYVSLLTNRYCGTLSIEFDHIREIHLRSWLANKMEQARIVRSAEEKKSSLEAILQGEIFDSELHTNFLGAKRFSLSGADAASAMLRELQQRAAEQSIREIILGMAHRGRLSTLAFFAGKPLAEIASEFKDVTQSTAIGAGDVKYHMGYSSTRTLANGMQIRCEIPPNPSHLEFVNPVVHGITRAHQDVLLEEQKREVLPVLIHGDASFAGQGIVAEVLAYAGLKSHETRGTIHLILNNQVGFTTDYREGHSGPYCSDCARGYDVPVLHVNGEDIEAAVYAINMALEYRQTFARDIVIDLICYRKFGHNEGDDPTFTQPLMYQELSKRPSVASVYAQNLIAGGELTQSDFDQLKHHVVSTVKAALAEPARLQMFHHDASIYVPEIQSFEIPNVSAEQIQDITQKLVSYPTGFNPHGKLAGILKKRSDNAASEKGIEWGLAEAIAFASLLQEGTSIRLSGQDSGRGTFSHRHSELHDTTTGDCYYPLRQFANHGSRFEVLNSFLSENAVLGFEFGYATQQCKTLVLWEAQFGDFSNGAQPIIDQFIASSEIKWEQRSDVVLLLPHGFEGQGPEHSSARLERFLQLAALNNMRVVQPSNAAQYFHLLRSQAHLAVKKPLIVMTPKSLLRYPDAGSSTKELTDGAFREVLLDVRTGGPKEKTLVACSGRVYYEVKKWAADNDSLVIARFEQLYPFPYDTLERELAGHSIARVVWVQDEPENMGPCRYITPILESHFSLPVAYVGRFASATTATGSPNFHVRELQGMEKHFRAVVA